MSLDRSVVAFAGIMVLLSVVLTVWVSPLFVWLTVFVGLNLLQPAFTGLLPGCDGLSQTRREAGHGLLSRRCAR